MFFDQTWGRIVGRQRDCGAWSRPLVRVFFTAVTTTPSQDAVLLFTELSIFLVSTSLLFLLLLLLVGAPSTDRLNFGEEK